MADNTNVNNNAAVVVVGRTAPVPPGQQKSDKSIPVVIANDQSTIPVAEQNKVQSEVALSLLGIPRSEVALGIFADVNTYDVNPTEWSATPEQFSTYTNEGVYAGVQGAKGQSWGLSHIPSESGALIEAPADKNAVLTSKRFFRYQPGRVSAATFGVKTTTIGDPGSTVGGVVYGSSNSVNGSPVANNVVANPAIRKYGIFDKYDGYYWETRNDGKGDNFCVVRRTQSLAYKNPLAFDSNAGDQTADYGYTNPPSADTIRGSESLGYANYGEAGANVIPVNEITPVGYAQTTPFGDLCVLRDKLLLSHAGVYDPSILQPEHKCEITSVTTGAANPTFTFGVAATPAVNNTGIAVSISNAVYSITSGKMTVTTHNAHGFHDGKYVTLAGIAMTCRYSYSNRDGTGSLDNTRVKFYPNNRREYNIIEVPSTTSFVVNVGVSTVETYYHGGGWAVGLSTGQHVSYTKGSNAGIITGLVESQIYKVRHIGINTATGIVTCTMNALSASGAEVKGDYLDLDRGASEVAVPAGETGLLKVGHSNGSEDTVGIVGHYFVTPVPFIQPLNSASIDSTKSRYGVNNIRTGAAVTDTQGTGMFPYLYTDSNDVTKTEGYINTTLNADRTEELGSLRTQIDNVNNYYGKWINHNVDREYWNVYEYRVPRSRFSGDRLDGVTDKLLYSDSVPGARPGQSVTNTSTGAKEEDVSIWDLEFDKVTMYKIEFSWYGAVGALFLAYVPVGAGEARWVRVHHLRASNQLKVASLGNATLPITYMCYGGGNQDRFGYLNERRIAPDDLTSASQNIVKYGASYYIDGGDRGTVKLFSHATPSNIDVYGSKRRFVVGSGTTQMTLTNSTDTTAPYITAGATSGLSSSFYVGSKVITTNPLDQNIKITYIDLTNRRLYLNSPLNSASLSTVDIIVDRPTPLVGIKCRDFIESSTGQTVRNRTQVYPTRMSSGSDALLKVDFIKSPIFQTESVISGTVGGPTIGISTFIGRRGKPTKVSVPLTSYTGTHTYVEGSTTKTAAIKVVSGGATKNIDAGSGSVEYNSTTGVLTITSAGHGLANGAEVRLLKEAFAFKCALDDYATIHKYPRAIDPLIDGTACTGGNDFNGAVDGNYSRPTIVRNKTTNTFEVSVTTDHASNNVSSDAEYIRDIGKGTYGWFRGYFASDITKKPISVFGYLENRGSDRTKNIEDDGYYFSAEDSTNDDIVLETDLPFLRETNVTPTGTPTTSAVSEFTLEQLSSIKISPQVRSPIPGTGTIVASVYAPAGGEEWDLSPYFDYNKEYLSFPLTNKVESLFVCGSHQQLFDRPELYSSSTTSTTLKPSISASLTWEEQ